MNLAEKNKGSLDMVTPKFRDRNVVTFLPLLGKIFLQIWSIYPSKCWKFNAEQDYDYKKLFWKHLNKLTSIHKTGE